MRLEVGHPGAGFHRTYTEVSVLLHGIMDGLKLEMM